MTLSSKKTWTKGHWPLDDLWSHVCWGHMCDSTPRIIVSKAHENTSNYVDTVTLFSKTWTKGHWPLDDLWPQGCWGHMCDSTQGSPKSHGNPLKYVDTVINFAKLPHTTYYIHTTYYVQNEWSHSLLLNTIQVRQKGYGLI